MNDDPVFDYQYLSRQGCQYPVPSRGTPNQEMDCGTPAVARVWWHVDADTLFPIDAMLVCEEHFQYILACETKKKNSANLREKA